MLGVGERATVWRWKSALPDTAHPQESLGPLPSMPWAFIEGTKLWRLPGEGLFVLKLLQPPDPRAWQGPSWDAVGRQPCLMGMSMFPCPKVPGDPGL